MNRRRIISVTVFISAVIIIILVFSSSRLMDKLSDFLTKSERVDADLLLVEGWLPQRNIIRAAEEFRKNGYHHIVTTGISSSEPFINMYSNGYLIFRTGRHFKDSAANGSHTIEIECKGEPETVDSAHFNVFINNALAGDFYAGKAEGICSVAWNGRLNEIDSISVRFDNDRFDSSGDINLYIKGIRIDHQIYIPYLNNSEYVIHTSDGYMRIINNINSCAARARKMLIVAGIDSSFVTAVPAKNARINRTLSSALAFREWLNSSGVEIKGINIISEGPHARRTWLTYTSILHKKYPVGIIAEPYNPQHGSRFKKSLKTIREAIGLIWYRIILNIY